MVVQHNLTAMNSNRMLGLTTASQAKSTEKLSSGYKINRAADDAAGLSISEKMRKQIRGLTQASSNAQDGISAVQTAEGALNEVQDMLQRMNELAVKASNGTNSEDDRTYIQNEIDQLTTEIDRVAETTKFNETYLLKGDRDATQKYTYKYNTPTTDAAATATMTAPTDAATNNLGVTNVAFEAGADKTSQNVLAAALKNQGVTITSTSAWDGTANKAKDTEYTVTLNGSAAQKFDVVAGADATTKVIQDKNGKKIATITVGGGTATTSATDGTAGTVTNTAKQTATAVTAAKVANESAEYFDKDGNAIPANALDKYFTVNSDGDVVARGDAPKVFDAVGNQTELLADEVTATQDLTGSLTLTLHVGADATDNNQISVTLDAMSAKGLGVNGLKVDGADDTNALNAIDTIKEAIQKVSTQRSALGAVQNRLEHTINNLDNVVENTTSAESQIRDTDMATEMVKYSNNNILAQAGQAMLAQSNQSNQGVLSLLQ